MRVVTFYVRRGLTCPRQKLSKLVRAVCKRFGLVNVTVGVAIVGNNHIRSLNKKFLCRNAATDCLAFDLSAGRGPKWFELVINGEKAVSEAAKRGHSPQAELALYVTHGLLHNLGFDDLTPAKAKQMHRIEDEILRQQGFGRVYDNENKVVSNKRRQKC